MVNLTLSFDIFIVLKAGTRKMNSAHLMGFNQQVIEPQSSRNQANLSSSFYFLQVLIVVYHISTF